MNFKSLSAGVVLAGAVATGAFASAPAQALSLSSGFLSFSGAAKFSETTNNLEFLGVQRTVDVVNTGPFPNNTEISVANLSFLAPTTNLDGSTTWELNGSDIPWLTIPAGSPNPIEFRLSTFSLTKLLPQGSTSGGEFQGEFAGIFRDNLGNLLPSSDGELSSQRQFSLKGDSYSASVTAVPTPALLPGLIGMGVAAWRQRKGATAEKTETKV